MKAAFGTDDDNLWTYNCLDCVYTREVGEAELAATEKLGMIEVAAFQQDLFYPVLHAMLKGVRIDLEERKRMLTVLDEEAAKREQFFARVLGHSLNPRSSKQMQALFYDDLKLPVQWSRPKKGEDRHRTCDDEALKTLALREPLIRPLVKAIQEYRSIAVFRDTFVKAPLDEDNRMRCYYNISGTETLRLASSANVFGNGTNLQNLPAGGKLDKEDELDLPNIKTLFIPDQGFEFFDMDLSRADLYTVVWEADDSDLKKAMRLGLDMHCFSACNIFGIPGIPPEELIETHPNYKEHRARIGNDKRQKAKAGCHAVNYFCQAKTLAIHLGGTVMEAQQFIDRWLGAHPGIKAWHTRTEEQLLKRRYVENAFGYRRYYFERTDGLLPAALAWIPQTTTGNVINRIWMHLFNHEPAIQVLLQVHDSLGGQFPLEKHDYAIEAFHRAANSVIVPYDDPLCIPIGIKTSPVSWGHCG